MITIWTVASHSRACSVVWGDRPTSPAGLGPCVRLPESAGWPCTRCRCLRAAAAAAAADAACPCLPPPSRRCCLQATCRPACQPCLPAGPAPSSPRPAHEEAPAAALEAMRHKARGRGPPHSAAGARDEQTVALVNQLLLERPVRLKSAPYALPGRWCCTADVAHSLPTSSLPPPCLPPCLPCLLLQLDITRLRKVAAIRGLVNDGVRCLDVVAAVRGRQTLLCCPPACAPRRCRPHSAAPARSCALVCGRCC